jgi:hypothetical protein
MESKNQEKSLLSSTRPEVSSEKRKKEKPPDWPRLTVDRTSGRACITSEEPWTVKHGEEKIPPLVRRHSSAWCGADLKHSAVFLKIFHTGLFEFLLTEEESIVADVHFERDPLRDLVTVFVVRTVHHGVEIVGPVFLRISLVAMGNFLKFRDGISHFLDALFRDVPHYHGV